MPTRKIGDLPKPSDGWCKSKDRPCYHPEHNPPSMISLPPGIYEHECPACGHKAVFRVDPYMFHIRESSPFYSEPEWPVYDRQRWP